MRLNIAPFGFAPEDEEKLLMFVQLTRGYPDAEAWADRILTKYAKREELVEFPKMVQQNQDLVLVQCLLRALRPVSTDSSTSES